jgi:hypothetical protein
MGKSEKWGNPEGGRRILQPLFPPRKNYKYSLPRSPARPDAHIVQGPPAPPALIRVYQIGTISTDSCAFVKNVN